MSTIVRPINQDNVSGWLQTNADSLFEALDEITPDDNDSIDSSNNGDQCDIIFDNFNINKILGSGTYTIRIRGIVNGLTASIDCDLYGSNNNLVSNLGAFSSGVLSTSEFTLDQSVVDDLITAGINGCFIRFTSNLGLAESVSITWMEFEAPPYKPSGEITQNKTFVPVDSSINFSFISKQDTSSWVWNFGDSNTSNSLNPLHSYSIQGLYSPYCTLTGPGGVTEIDNFGTLGQYNIGVYTPISNRYFANNSQIDEDSWITKFNDGNNFGQNDNNAINCYILAGLFIDQDNNYIFTTVDNSWDNLINLFFSDIPTNPDIEPLKIKFKYLSGGNPSSISLLIEVFDENNSDLLDSFEISIINDGDYHSNEIDLSEVDLPEAIWLRIHLLQNNPEESLSDSFRFAYIYLQGTPIDQGDSDSNDLFSGSQSYRSKIRQINIDGNNILPTNVNLLNFN